MSLFVFLTKKERWKEVVKKKMMNLDFGVSLCVFLSGWRLKPLCLEEKRTRDSLMLLLPLFDLRKLEAPDLAAIYQGRNRGKREVG